MKRLAFIGECMIELSEDGAASGPGAMRRTFGGDSLNSAVYAARCLGGSSNASVDYVTILGDDPFSAEMLAAWRAEGVGTGLITQIPGALPGLYAIRTDAAGERSFHYWRSQAPARGLFSDSGGESLAAALAAFDLVYFSGITLAIMHKAGRARLFNALAQVRQQGGGVAFDSNYRPRLWPDEASAQREITQGATAATLNLSSFEDEHLLFGDTTPEASARRLHGLGAPEVVIKNGAEDCLVSLEGAPGGKQWRVSPPRVARPVDTTAAGDSFNAAYIAARMTGATADNAARRGVEFASRVIQHQGAIMPESSY